MMTTQHLSTRMIAKKPKNARNCEGWAKQPLSFQVGSCVLNDLGGEYTKFWSPFGAAWGEVRGEVAERTISSLANNIGIPWMTSKGDGLQFPGRVNHCIA